MNKSGSPSKGGNKAGFLTREYSRFFAGSLWGSEKTVLLNKRYAISFTITLSPQI